MGYIYLIKNKINDKVYIGKTTRSYQRRWYEHIYKAYNDQKLYAINQAIKKYGEENFDFSILEKCSDEELNKKEKEYIELYHSYIQDFGYNLTFGGDGDVRVDRAKIIQKWNEGKACCDIAKELNSTSDTVCMIIKELFPDSAEEIKKRSNEKVKIFHQKPILQYDEDGHLINHFSSIKDATKIYGSGISRAIIEKIKAQGYYWCFDDGIDHISDILKQPKGGEKKYKKVIQYDLNGNYIAKYNSVKEATSSTKASHIGDVCNGKRKSAGGFLWKWDEN